MTEKTLEVTEKEAHANDAWEVTESQEAVAEVATTVGGQIHVTSRVFVFHPEEKPDAPETFTRGSFENALDKVSRPTSRGKYAHVPYSSEDLIRDKRAEVELEDRPS